MLFPVEVSTLCESLRAGFRLFCDLPLAGLLPEHQHPTSSLFIQQKAKAGLYQACVPALHNFVPIIFYVL